MGKRRNERPPGGDGKFHVPKTKRSFQEDSEAMGNDSLDATGPAQTGDADRKPKPAAGGAEDRGEATPGSTATNAPRSANGDGEEAAPEQSRAGECVASPLPQEGGDAGIGGGGKSPEAAAPGAASRPESPQRANSVVDEAEGDQPVAATEQHGSAGEEPDTETQTHRGTGNIGDSPKHGCAAPARGEGAAGGEIALPVDTPGRSTGSSAPAEVPDPHREEGVDRREPGERRGDADQSQEPPHTSVLNTEENESGAVSERAAGGEHQENASRERLRAHGTNEAAKNVADSWSSPAGGIISAEVSGVCAPSAGSKAEGGTAEPESAGADGTVGPVSRPPGGNTSPRKTSGEADAGREEAGGGGTPSPGTSSVLDPAGMAVGNPAGEREGEGLAEVRRGAEHAVNAPRTGTQPPARSSDLPRGGGIAESAPTIMAMPGPAPPGTAEAPAAGTGAAVAAEPRDETPSAGELPCPRSELQGVLEDNALALPPQQPLADRRDSAVPGRRLCAAAGRSHAEEAPPLAEGNGPDQPQPRGEEPEGLRPPARGEDATDVDATDVICGLILELSNLNRLAMSAHRGLEALRRPKPRRSRRPGPGPVRAGRRWKET